MSTPPAERDQRAMPLAPADLAECGRRLGAGSRSFDLAARLLPRRPREAATGLYAFCRLADDAVDHADGARARAEQLDALRARLDAAYAGRPRDDAADRALAVVVHEHAIPRTLLEALLEGFAWDAAGHRYASMGELRAYSARVAGSVGVMMALVMGVRGDATLARSADLGVAMQLTNIARDVGEDARAGRLYLPLDRLAAAGIDPDAWLQRPAPCAGIAHVVDELLVEAERLYRRADTGIARLPAGCRPAIRAARHVYAAIGAAVRRRDLDSVTARAIVPRGRKAALALRALAPTPGAGRAAGAWSALAETRYLVNAVPVEPVPLEAGSAGSAPAWRWWDLRARFIWTIELFLRLEARQRLDSAARSVSK